MAQTFEAVYDGAVLRPETALGLEPNTRVRLTMEVLPPPAAKSTSFLDTARSLDLQRPSRLVGKKAFLLTCADLE